MSAKTPPRLDPAAAARGIERAIAEGRHSERCQRVCGECGRWVDAIYHLTIDRKPLCPGCADKFGVGPQAWRRRQIGAALHIAAQREMYAGGVP